MYTCQCEWCETGHEQWCSVKGGGCISKMSLNRGVTVCVGMSKSWFSGFMPITFHSLSRRKKKRF